MNETLSLWQLLNKKQVIIPRIQRDYAQGRKGKEYIRSTFLGELCRHLKEEKPLTLDFVYGNAEANRFFPLDGQQRITTLWLLHWFLALKTGRLDTVKDTLLNFTYETRTSSHEFCKALCEKMHGVNTQVVAAYIQSQTWFFSEWMLDPTINAMLRTISGDGGNEKNDNLEQVFADADWEACWKGLTDNNLVTFKLMIIGSDKLPLSDDLYIKMNARGKKLTDFENFKADWVSHIQKSDDKSIMINGKHCSQYYPEKIDNAWTDVFWNYAKNDPDFNGHIDSMFFAFINRFVLNRICIQNNTVPPSNFDAKKHTTEDKNIQRIQTQFAALYRSGVPDKKKSDADNAISYEGFDLYSSYLGADALKTLDAIFTSLASWSGDQNLSISQVDDQEDAEIVTSSNSVTFSLIPPFSSDGKVKPATQKERVYFHALCVFLEAPVIANFNQWWRVVRNLTENAAIDTIEAMITCLRFIDGLGHYLSAHNWDVYANLDKYSYRFDGVSRFSLQWAEEQEKAKQIYAHREFEKKISEAEGYSFFNGTIRFLFRDAAGNIDWSRFDTKFNNAKRLFNNTTATNNTNNNVDACTVKALLSQFTSFDEIQNVLSGKSYLFTTIGYHPRYACWKTSILCNTDLVKQVDALLSDNSPSLAVGILKDFIADAVDTLCAFGETHRYRYREASDWAVRRDYNTSDGIYVTEAHRNKLTVLRQLHTAGDIQISGSNPLLGKFIWGLKISFHHQGKPFQWDGATQIWSDAVPGKLFIWEREDAAQLLTELNNF